MKKIVKLTLAVASIMVIGTIGYMEVLFDTYGDRNVKTYTGICNYTIVKKVHNDHEWYAKMSINEMDGEKLLKRYPFKLGYNITVLVGKPDNDYIKDCPDCWCYLDDRNRGIYGYVLYFLSANKKQLEIYELFGD